VGLTVREIRDRAERFHAAVLEEMFDGMSGRKPWPELQPLYASQGLLAWEETAPPIERELAGAAGESERQLRRLLGWAGEHQVRSDNADLDDEYRMWHSTASVELDDTLVPVRRLDAMIESEPDRQARARLADLRSDAHSVVVPLQLDRLNRWRISAEELGYGSHRQAVQRLSGVNLDSTLREARRLLSETRELYEAELDYQLSRRFGELGAEAEAHDIEWLARMDWLELPCQESSILDTVRTDLSEIGLELEQGGRVDLTIEAFPGPGMKAFCSPIRVPDQVVLFVTPTVTPGSCRKLLWEIGEAVHWSRTDPSLPFEYRSIGDRSVAEAHGALFADLALNPAWVRRAKRVAESQHAEYLRLASWLDLYDLRSVAARLQFDLEACESDRPGSLGARWAELMYEATLVRHDPRDFLTRLGQRFGSARGLRARLLSATLARVLEERFDADWYRNPRSGKFLREWLAGGLSRGAAELSELLGQPGLVADPLIATVRDRLG
jgi:hypothetical protein